MQPSHRSPLKRALLAPSREILKQANVRQCKSICLKQAIDSLFQVHTWNPSHERGAITAAIAVFIDKLDDETTCNVAVETGAAHALTLQLGYALNRAEFGSSKSTSSDAISAVPVEIVRSILQALSIVYKCSEIVRYQSFVATGEEVVPLVISTIIKSKSVKRQEHQTEAGLAEYNCPKEIYDERMTFYGIRVLSVLSLVDAAKHQMAAYQSVLEILVNVFKEDLYNQARNDALTLLKHLSTHTGENYKLRIVRFPQLLKSLVRFFHANSNKHAESRHSQVGEDMSFIVRQLSNGKLTKLHLAERGDVVNMLIRLSSDDNARAKREAISAILGLALVIENRVLLMRHSEGAVSSALAHMLKYETDYVVRRRAARALRCMACADTVDLFLQGQSFTIEALSSVSLLDTNEEVRIESAKALSAWIMASDLVPISNYCVLLNEAINLISSSHTSSCIDSVSSALLFQAKFSDNHFSMATNSTLLSALYTVIYKDMISSEAKENVINIIRHLTTTQADVLLQQEGSHILNVLVYVLMSSSGNFAGTAKFSIECQNSSLDIVAQLSSRLTCCDGKNNSTMNIAKHKGLMVALLRYSANIEDTFRKATAKKTIIKLVPFM